MFSAAGRVRHGCDILLWTIS